MATITLQVQYGQSVQEVTLNSDATVGQLKQALVQRWPALSNTRYVLTFWGADLVDDNLPISSGGANMVTGDYVAIRYVVPGGRSA